MSEIECCDCDAIGKIGFYCEADKVWVVSA